jgi:hypothetical protein
MDQHTTEKTNYIWAGPTIPRLGIRKNMLILGSNPPPQLKNFIETKPMYRSLFIPTTRIAEVRENIRMLNSMENISYLEIVKFNREKVTIKKESK